MTRLHEFARKSECLEKKKAPARCLRHYGAHGQHGGSKPCRVRSWLSFLFPGIAFGRRHVSAPERSSARLFDVPRPRAIPRGAQKNARHFANEGAVHHRHPAACGVRKPEAGPESTAADAQRDFQHAPDGQGTCGAVLHARHASHQNPRFSRVLTFSLSQTTFFPSARRTFGA